MGFFMRSSSHTLLFQCNKNITQPSCLKAKLGFPTFKTPLLKMPSSIQWRSGQMHTVSNTITDLLHAVFFFFLLLLLLNGNFSFRRKASEKTTGSFSFKPVAFRTTPGRKLHSTLHAHHRLKGQVFPSNVHLLVHSFSQCCNYLSCLPYSRHTRPCPTAHRNTAVTFTSPPSDRRGTLSPWLFILSSRVVPW